MMTTIAIPSISGDGLDSEVDFRFGRAIFFTFVTVEDGKVKEVTIAANPAMNAMGGAGSQSVSFIMEHGADTAFAIQLGPNAAVALKASGANVLTRTDFSSPPYTVKQIIDEFIEGKLVSLEGANVPGHAGGMHRHRYGQEK